MTPYLDNEVSIVMRDTFGDERSFGEYLRPTFRCSSSMSNFCRQILIQQALQRLSNVIKQSPSCAQYHCLGRFKNDAKNLVHNKQLFWPYILLIFIGRSLIPQIAQFSISFVPAGGVLDGTGSGGSGGRLQGFRSLTNLGGA